MQASDENTTTDITTKTAALPSLLKPDRSHRIPSPTPRSTSTLSKMAQQAMAPLPPFDPPIGVFPQFCQSVPVTLKMKEKGMFSGSLTGDDFSITDVNGREGKELFALKNKLFKISKSFYAEGPNGATLFEVKGHFSLLSSKSTIHFTNASTHQPMVLDLKGDWLDRSAEISLQGRPVGNISRSFMNFGQLVSDRQTYFVNCAPGVDLVLMAAICVCLDERENESK
ncbi:MAG: hypothetical protein Q9217_005354 [Psora testacea]